MIHRTLVRALVPLLFPLIAAACTRDPQAAKQKYMASGDRYLASGKVAEAIIEYRNAVQKDPRGGDAHVKLADAYFKAGQVGSALAEYIRAADLLPDDQEVRLKTSGVLLLADRFDDAKLWAEKVLEKEPANLRAQILLANSLAGLRDFEAAIAQIDEAIKLNPDRGETYTNLGAIQVSRGRKAEAERAFLRAVEIDGNSAAARLALGNFYWADSRWQAAEEQLLKVVELEPSNVQTHRFLASFYIATNRVAEAEPHLLKFRELSPSPEASFALADFYAAQKDETSARNVLKPLAEAGATAAVAEVKLAMLDRRGGHNDEAYERLARVLKDDRTNLAALLAKTSFLARDGRVDEALESATLAVQKHQDSTAALFALGGVQAQNHQTDQAIASFEKVLNVNPRATDAKVALATLQLGQGRAEASVGLARDAVASQPQNLQARLTLVRAMLAQNDLKRAEPELQFLAEKVPNSAAIEGLQGLLSVAKKDATAARKHFERALQLDRDSYEAITGLVVLDLTARKFPEARARVDEEVARNGKSAAILMLAARTYGAMGDAAKAESLLRQSIQTDPAFLDAYAALAQLYIVQKKTDQALVELEQLSKRDSRPVGAYTLMGMIQQAAGKDKEASEQFTRALQLDPEAPVAANNLAWLYAASDDQLDRALELALRAKAKLPDRPEINDTIGWVYYRRGLATDAIPYFSRSIEKDANNPIYHYHLGLAFVKSGDAAKGKLALERALKLKPDFAGSDDARQTLQRLPG